jgi:NTE family protein
MKVAYSFRGGGSKAAAYVGALKALEENGINPDLLIGSSSGSLIAAAYGLGVPKQKLLNQLGNFSPKKYIGLDSLHDLALGSDDKTLTYVKELLGDVALEDSKIPIIIQITNLTSGKLDHFSKGDAAEIALTSALLPFVFGPRKIGDQLFTDGDVLAGYGVELAKEQGIQKVIAFEPEDAYNYTEPGNRFSATLKMLQLMRRKILDLDKAKNPPSYIIRTPTLGVNMMDFSKSEELAEKSYNMTLGLIPEIKKSVGQGQDI